MEMMEHFTLPNIDVYLVELPTNMAKRKAEQLAKETLLREVIGEDVCLTYTAEGKPMLPDRFISISHSKHHLCVALSKTQEIGIDIEEIQLRIARLLSHFLNEDEIAACQDNLILATRCWAAKEAVYKIVGKEAGATGMNIHIETEKIHEDTFYATCKQHRFALQLIVNNTQQQAVIATEITQ